MSSLPVTPIQSRSHSATVGKRKSMATDELVVRLVPGMGKSETPSMDRL